MDNKIIFKKKPIPLPAEYRPMYQIALIVLILKYCCRANTSSRLKLHLFSWCLYSEKNMTIIRQFIANRFKTMPPHWSIDPVVNRALILAVADGIFEKTTNNKYKLSRKGLDFATKLESDKELLCKEKVFLQSIGRAQISDTIVEKITIKELGL